MLNTRANHDPVVLLRKEMDAIKPSLSYNGGDVNEWQRKLRTKLRELLRIDNMPSEKCPLNVQSVWEKKHEYGTIEKIIFDSEPGYSIPAYLCLPAKSTNRYTAFICLQGHSTGMHNSIAVDKEDENKIIEVKGDRDFGITCMKIGIAALCIEQRAFGETVDKSREHYDRCHNPSMLSLMCGRTIIGQRVYDVERAIDYLYTRDDVNHNSIGVMGNSGGGTVSLYAAALLNRLNYCMPSCSFSSYKASIMSVNHCLCNYVPDLLLYAKHADIGGLIAPRPLVIVNGVDDPLFPIKESKKEVELIQRIYREIRAEENCQHIVCEGGHRFYADAAWPVMLGLCTNH